MAKFGHDDLSVPGDPDATPADYEFPEAAQRFLGAVLGNTGETGVPMGPGRSRVITYNANLRAEGLSAEEKLAIFNAFSPLVVAAVIEVTGGELPEDALQELYLVLWKNLIRNSDENPRVNNRNHLLTIFDQALMNLAAHDEYISREDVARVRTLRDAYETLYQELGRAPSAEEMAYHAGLPNDEAAVLIAAVGPLLGESADEPLPLDEGALSAADVLTHASPWADDQRPRVGDLVIQLSERDLEIVGLHALQGMSFKAIGQQLGMGESTVRDRWGVISRKLQAQYWRLRHKRANQSE